MGGEEVLRFPLEAHTRTQINLRLMNLGWNLNEKDPSVNVTQEQALTEEQNKRLHGKRPDYVLYESGSRKPIGIIEAKRPGENLDDAMQQCCEYYADPLEAPLAFAFNDTFVIAKHVPQNRPLKIDGEELQDFIDQLTALRFANEGAEILSAPKGVNCSRSELLDIFKATNNLLRKEGLRDGYERFSAFAEVLFLKLIDESERLKEHQGLRRTFDKRFCWSEFTQKYKNGDLLVFLHDSVYPRLRQQYGDMFNAPLAIKNSSTLTDIIKKIDPINLTATDTDVKGDAFEYFLKSVTNRNKDLGEYFTPRHIVRTMVNLVKPIYGEKIYDPFCGTGGFLLETFRYLSSRLDIRQDEIMTTLKQNTIWGREITSTARIAKMNMVLFGDGHSNIEQMDSLSSPYNEKFDIILSNIPYSQKTEYGKYYDVPTQNADAICVQHIWKALRPHGRAAVIVPETFLYEGGVIGATRELIAKQSEKMTVISLPRGVFMPYTPTKTNILYFQKGGQFKKAYFFVIHNDGFELNTGRKPRQGESDLKKLLSEYDMPSIIQGQATIVTREEVEQSETWNLRPFYYMEDIPDISGELFRLDQSIIVEVYEKIDPRNEPDKLWGLLEVSQNGIFLSDQILGSEYTQAYKVVKSGDLVYNPYRINIGSIGIVPPYYHQMLVSPAYIVLRPISKEFPATYLLSILKSPRYQRIIMNYSLSSARANLPVSELMRIKIPKPTGNDLAQLNILEKDVEQYSIKVNDAKMKIELFAKQYLQ